jgi:NAD(P)-dependent dehydrogenase (short-subunit alcohol dehydrogenase family)
VNQFPQFDLSSKIALVTASARGLGRAISLALAHCGADIALGLRDRSADGGLPGEIETLGRRVLPLQMDMTCLEQIFRAVDQTASHFGRLDILVNNAGVAPENLAERIAALHRIGQPMDVAGSVVFLASPAASPLRVTHYS